MGASDLAVYRECTPVVDEVFDVENGQSPVEAIVHAVAEATGNNPSEVAPLYEYIDTDAVNSLFDHDGAANAGLLLRFTIETLSVFIGADGKIRVYDTTQLTAPEPVSE